MTSVRIWLSVILLLSAPAFLKAQSQQEMNQDALKQSEAADKELNAVYKKVFATLDDEAKELLKASQRAWLAYREAEAKFAADEMRGGTAAPLIYSGAITRMTMSRIRRLHEVLSETTAEENTAKTEVEPEGADSMKKAGELFFKAYSHHDRKAAAKIANDTALNELLWDAKAGEAEGLKLMDPTHLYYVGGSIELKMKKNTEGRWYVSGISSTAD